MQATLAGQFTYNDEPGLRDAHRGFGYLLFMLAAIQIAIAWLTRDSWRYRMVWLSVLGVGLAFGLSGVRPIPAIIVAQALNGVVLPLVAVFLLLAVNDRGLMGADAVNGRLANTVMGVVVAVSLVLGAGGLLRAGAATLGRPAPGPAAALVVAALAAVPVAVMVWRQRRL